MKTNTKTSESKAFNKKKPSQKIDNEPLSESIVLEAVGYPFDFNLMETNLEISDEKLFEEYAKEQWLGLIIKTGTYLFDQKIIPDFAFKVKSVKPENSVLSENTKITVTKESIQPKKVEHEKSDLKVSDIVGQKNAKNKTKVLRKFLEDPEKFGKWAPHNILFYGLPGTGKTMLAKALTNELEVPLYLIKATSLIGDHVGDGASKIHDLFEKAQKTAPSVIFIDEIDAVALHRSFQSLRGDVAEIVNALLTEMDGISENKGVITIGATNNPNTLDHAVRSRFEQEIEFKIPDEKERKEIILKNIETYPVENNFNIEKLVKITKNMSGRDIKEKILKTALHHGISNDKQIIDMKDIEFALKSAKHKNNDVEGMHE
ncbi:AAA family ATPase [Methanobrevibacter sp. OttesenSCG-928-K11]|nr:AAA family ATPase [Methanobrevibacter sp. OttesenSCG-928-K11]